jgi:hypothetical protein
MMNVCYYYNDFNRHKKNHKYECTCALKLEGICKLEWISFLYFLWAKNVKL